MVALQYNIDNEINNLIDIANSIVYNCNGNNCNTSSQIRELIKVELVLKAEEYYNNVINNFNILKYSEKGREIYNAYLNLANSISSSYNYNCGDNTLYGKQCTLSSQNVIDDKEKLNNLILPIRKKYIIMIISSSILGLLFLLFIFLFFVLFIISLLFQNETYVETMRSYIKPLFNNNYIGNNKLNNNNYNGNNKLNNNNNYNGN